VGRRQTAVIIVNCRKEMVRRLSILTAVNPDLRPLAYRLDYPHPLSQIKD
jgi:hypothetical protein